MIDAEARDRILQVDRDGQEGGAARLRRPTSAPLADEGYYVGPHDLRRRAARRRRIAQEEIFGPVLAVIKAKDLDDALRIANGTKYALTGGVSTPQPGATSRR